ncbi:hypothetical protein LBMAG49_11570 [Planctomycetota bacterium]|nr:hypothetical protein LBMAG49_11570 [Planctomycetota bacterium]
MKRPCLVLWTAACFCWLVFSASLNAQVEGQNASSRQEVAQAKFRELTDRMQALMVILTKDDPHGDARLISVGLKFIAEKRIKTKMESAQSLLTTEKWDDAQKLMTGIQTDLRQLLELLQNRSLDLQKLLEEIARLEAFRSEVDRLVKEQGDEKNASARLEELQKQGAAIEQAKLATERLIAEQQKLRNETNKLGVAALADAMKPLADQQGELQKGADQLAKDLAALEKQSEELKPGDAKPGDAKPSDAKPSDAKPSDGKPGDGKPGDGAGSKSAKSAAKSMGEAQKQLGEKQPESSLKSQDEAVLQLKTTLGELDELAKEVQRELLKLPLGQQVQKQEDTEHATDTLAQKMEQAEKDAKDAEGKPTPGRKSVQQAVPKQVSAAGSLKEYKPAKQKQQDAKEDLEKARDELDEAINQLRQQLQDEVLRALEERFTAMLAKQRELSAQTKTLDKTRTKVLTADGSLPTGLVERIQVVATGEQDLDVEAGDALKLLEEEGTTAVFPEIVSELKSQLHDLAKACRANMTGIPIQVQQKDVEETLALLINALRKAIEQKDGKPDEGKREGSPPPLVPISAELKMLKLLQTRVNRVTKDYEQGTPEVMRETDDAKADAASLSKKQARVRDLTRKLALKLNQEGGAEGGR